LHEHKGDQHGGGKMSILLHASLPVKKLVAKSKHVQPSTSSILLISVALFIAFFLLVNIGMLLPETTVNSTCREKIVDFEQSGIYTNSGQFKLALSYCEAK
jgi:hypothetical protein